ncbi:tripartite tricarboxylate transporter TctB family protein [Modicisalibacter radicis]|uniref:tripartite tricarboxylate transporter TctB family protein n=1 Tax=Halomonas sp. EAR18 TaxID=2518972 RepID=UPI00109D1987|nr:tripartite tricarboxylate transporter TctB family protein [Halomonas sp. EAR18]
MRVNDLLFSLLFILLFVVAATQITQLSEIASATVSARLFPEMVIGGGILMGVIEMIRTLVSRPRNDDPGFRESWKEAFLRRRMYLLGLFTVYLIAITHVGFLVATAVFCFVTILVLAPRIKPASLVIALAVTVGLLGLIYVLLVVYLKAFLP